MRRLAKSIILLIFMASSSVLAQGEPPPPTETGFPPYGSFEYLAFDTVNRQSLNVHFEIPILESPGRGFALAHSIVYDSKIWKIGQVNSEYAWIPVTNASGIPTWGWRTDLTTGEISWEKNTVECGSVPPPSLPATAQCWQNYAYTDPAGTRHVFPVSWCVSASEACQSLINNNTATGIADDGSGYYIDATLLLQPVVFSPSGFRIETTGRMTDPNGNYISKTIPSPNNVEWKDSRGKTALKVNLNPGSWVDYKVLDSNGTYQTTRLVLQTFQVKTDFQCPGVSEFVGSAKLPIRIDLPNGRSWNFTYEVTPDPGGTCFGGCVTGRLASVTLPTGGMIVYGQGAAPNMGVECSDGSQRSVARATSEGTWYFSRSIAPEASVTTIEEPLLPYNGVGTAFRVYTFSAGRETKAQTYAADGSLLATVDTWWTTGTKPTPRRRRTTIPGGQLQTRQVETDFDVLGNLLELREFNFGGASPGSAPEAHHEHLLDRSCLCQSRNPKSSDAPRRSATARATSARAPISRTTTRR
jgi:hypothetical protein